VRGIVFDDPVGLEIAGELKGFAVLVAMPLFGLAVFALSSFVPTQRFGALMFTLLTASPS